MEKISPIMYWSRVKLRNPKLFIKPFFQKKTVHEKTLKQKLDAVRQSGNSELVERIRDKFFYAGETDSNGQVKKIESTYVAKRYKQTEVNDNFETFAPTSNSGTLSTLLVWDATTLLEKFWDKVDVRDAYLHPKVVEGIYLEQAVGIAKWFNSRQKVVCSFENRLKNLKKQLTIGMGSL